MKNFCFRSANKLLMLLSVLLFLSLGACSSQPEVVDNGNPYADIADGFMTQEPRTYHEPKFKPEDYFYKHCDQTFDAVFYSKTSYFCNEH